ncbi:MAG: YfdX family protein [Bacteroidales bacterium]|nr:YfdX family protein [Bacteroidales bacterium]
MKKFYHSAMKAIPVLVLASCLFFGFVGGVSAQTRLISFEFYGEWTFERAQTQERALNSNDAYAVRDLTKEALSSEARFANIPLAIRIDPVTDVTTLELASGEPKEAFTALSTEDNSLIFIDLEAERENDHTTFKTTPSDMPVFFNPMVDGENGMTMQRNYTYRNAKGVYVQGSITIHYLKI